MFLGLFSLLFIDFWVYFLVCLLYLVFWFRVWFGRVAAICVYFLGCFDVFDFVFNELIDGVCCLLADLTVLKLDLT